MSNVLAPSDLLLGRNRADWNRRRLIEATRPSAGGWAGPIAGWGGRRHRTRCKTTVVSTISSRLAKIVASLPLREGMRVLEIGCGPGAAARAVVHRLGDCYVLGIDRSEKAIAQALAGSADEIASGRLEFRRVAAEDFTVRDGEAPFDMAFAIRVGTPTPDASPSSASGLPS